MANLADLRNRLRRAAYADEDRCVTALLQSAQLDHATRTAIAHQAAGLIKRSRSENRSRGTLHAFLQEFDLSNREGIALMCLAEALLRIPDSRTADALIAEKVHTADWRAHRGHSDSLFVNASVWGMIMTGKVVPLGETITGETHHWFRDLVSRLGEPVVRNAILQAIRMMGDQYVLGRTIHEALKRGPAQNPKGTRFSFDMLGEGARTDADAHRYCEAYLDAIKAIASNTHQKNAAADIITADGISIKLSALHPRFHQTKLQQLKAELLPRVRALAIAAKQGGMGLNIDAEEASRLDISLEIFDALARTPELEGWSGLGFVVQAYQKRAPAVVDWLIALARDSQRRLMVRLVKGAYWDSEIKLAQELGLADYPVFTRKANTDLSYLVCAQNLLNANDVIYPQFATHNAQTIVTVMHLAKSGQNYEFQRLHGMGDLLYQQLFQQAAEQGHPAPRLRVYAPVGPHRDLLPYLVRRLLENGANSSFVHRFLNNEVPVTELTEDVVAKVTLTQPYRHPKIPPPRDLFSHSEAPRGNAPGFNLEDAYHAEQLQAEMAVTWNTPYRALPIINGDSKPRSTRESRSPADPNLIVGQVQTATAEDIDAAMASAHAAQSAWNARGGGARADVIHAVAASLTAHTPELIGLISREAGRTLKDALSEVREAIDFCHYYAAMAKQHFDAPMPLMSPTGEHNEWALHGRGTFVCISPWNFPVAIFTGQIIGALAAGNSVIAKPAEQTPLVAARVVELMHAAGVPMDVLHLIPGVGSEVGPSLIDDPRTRGVAFTGSTATAQRINRQLAEREGAIIPLIAETGGVNAMIADSSALPEQLVDDIIASAFLSAGQRCSALRVLFLQDDIADPVLEMLQGACNELTVGPPWELPTDIGPVIDASAQAALQDHIDRMTENAQLLYAYPQAKLPAAGLYVGPHIFQLNHLSELKQEVFGPILHVVRYQSRGLNQVIEQINASGYGLTLGVHSRIEGRAQRIFQAVRVGNTYVNRNMVGAVVGVNPFGGQGLSGTGPKAGGPHYLFRFATEKTFTVNTTATGGNVGLFQLVGDE